MNMPLGSGSPANSVLDAGTRQVRRLFLGQGGDAIWPGLFLAGLIVSAMLTIRQLPGFSMFGLMVLSVVAGTLYSSFVGLAGVVRTGLAFCQKPLLRAGIVLLGFQVSSQEIIAVGLRGMTVVVVGLVATYAFAVVVARRLGVSRELAHLIAAGTSVCGASAIAAVGSANSASDDEIAYSIACITLLGTIAMFFYPLAASAMGMSPLDAGVWIGASIHEVGQVVGAGFQFGDAGGQVATATKLMRVVLLAPIVMIVAKFAVDATRPRGDGRPVVPWFVLGFLCAVFLNSLFDVGEGVRHTLAGVTTLILSLGLAAMGLQANVRKIWDRGIKPFVAATLAAIFLGGLSLLVLLATGHHASAQQAQTLL